jgi:hypothetical protein
MHKKMSCLSPKITTFDPSHSLEQWMECLCDPLDGNNSITEHLNKFSCQSVQTTIREPPCLWSMYVWLSRIFNHKYVENSSLKECPYVKLSNLCEHKGHFYMNIKTYFILTSMNINDVYAKFALKWQPLVKVNILAWTPYTTKKWPLPTFMFFYTFQSSPNCTEHVGRSPLWPDVYSCFDCKCLS